MALVKFEKLYGSNVEKAKKKSKRYAFIHHTSLAFYFYTFNLYKEIINLLTLNINFKNGYIKSQEIYSEI